MVLNMNTISVKQNINDINLRLGKGIIYDEIVNLNFSTIENKTLILRLSEAFKLTVNIIDNYLDNKNNLNGLERNDYLGKTNPLIWEFGHVFFFYEQMTKKLLTNQDEENLKIDFDPEIYDSFIVDRESRFNILREILNKKFDNNIEEFIVNLKHKLGNLFNYLYNYLNDKYISQGDQNNKNSIIDSYLFNISILHHEMHNESFIFTMQLLGVNFNIKFDNLKLTINNFLLDKYKNDDFIIENQNILKDIEFVNIESNDFIQGSNDYFNDYSNEYSNNNVEFSFDNERPAFKNKINKFSVSKYCITNFQYMEFVNQCGYEDKQYWTNQGWRWLQEKKIKHPIYWSKNDDSTFLINIFGVDYPLEYFYNNPVMNISWYEAYAFAKYKNCRLLDESEWEYLAKDNLKNNANLSKSSSLGRESNYTLSVLEDKNINEMGVVGLFGNVWEWCNQPIHPYDGFKIDPVYREMSYPYFGFKKICRGGCWCVPEYLVHSSYRNAQLPETTYQYIGFRLAK